MDVMKKITSILAAGLAFLSVFSCVKEEEFVYYDISNATAPVVQKFDVTDDGVSVNFSPASFGINDKMAQYALALVSVDGAATDEVLNSSVKEGVISVSKAVLTKTLLGMGKEEGSVVDLLLELRASLPGASDYIAAVSTIAVPGFQLAKSNPWAAFNDVSDWGVTGAIASVGFNWDQDIVMYTNGSQHVARAVVLSASDQFKFRKDHAWGENFGAEGSDEPFVCALDTPYPAKAGGKNLGVAADGVYDLLLDTDAGTFTISEAFLTYPGYDQASPWGVTGSIASFELNWDRDIAMITDGTWHVAEGVVLSTSDQFKFRKDQAWGENFGAEGDVEPFVCALDVEYPAKGGGKNLAVPADGTYDLLVNPDEGLFKVVESLGGKSGLIGGNEPPEPPAPPFQGYSLIGDFNGWGDDIEMTEDAGIWTAYLTVPEGGTTFKVRKDKDWEISYGGVDKNYIFYGGDQPDSYKPEYGTPFAVTCGPDIPGANIYVDEGFYEIVFDIRDENAPTITVTAAESWSLIGEFNSWAGDVDMTGEGGVWTSPVTKLSGEFKIRHNHDWGLNVGGEMAELGTPFAAVVDGPNIKLPAEGSYVVVYDTNDQTITVSAAGWGLVGTINGWGGTPDIPLSSEPDHSYLVARNVPIEATDEIKIRFNNSWDQNYGGPSSLGHSVKVEKDGANLHPGIDGNIDVYFFERDEVVIIAQSGTEVNYWGVVGTINGWAQPDYIMYEDENGSFVFDGLYVTGDDEIKIRKNEDWADNRGGAFNVFGEAFPVTNGGDNIKIGQAATINLSYNPAEETMTITGEYDRPENLWSVIGDFNGWGADAYMTEVFPGIWISNTLELTGGWKIRFNNGWDENRGGATPEAQGAFVKAVPGGDNLNLEGTFKVVYNANNETIGTLGWGVIGSIPSMGISWDKDIPMMLGNDGVWRSIPFTIADGDEFKIRLNADWTNNFGGVLEGEEEEFAAVEGGDNMKIVEPGTYMVVFDPASEIFIVTKDFWGMIGDFNGWGSDVFLAPVGGGVWAAYGQTAPNGWKIRKGSSWDVNRGGVYAASGEPFEVVQDGDNINTGDAEFDLVYDSAADTMTITVKE